MRIEIDQSGKIEQTNMDTVIAFSDGKSGTVRISAPSKRQLVGELRTAGYKGSSFYLRIFCAAVCLLLKPYLSELDQIIIDEEYTSKDSQIKEFLIRYLGEDERLEIEVGYVTKKSKAHKLAINVLRGKLHEDRTITAEELLEVIRKQMPG